MQGQAPVVSHGLLCIMTCPLVGALAACGGLDLSIWPHSKCAGSLAACGGLDISIWPIRKPWGKRKGRDEAGPEGRPRKKFAACAGFACIPSLAEDAAAIAAATAAAKAQHALPGTASLSLVHGASKRGRAACLNPDHSEVELEQDDTRKQVGHAPV